MPLSKKIRFEIFKRDSFKCGYCGGQPPEVVLEVDHITPVSKGGDDDINNLITACFDCNRGKTNIELDKIPSSVNENLEVLKIKEEQLKEYKKYIINYRKRIMADIKKVEGIFKEYNPERKFTDLFRVQIKTKFLKHLDVYTLCDNMEIACSKIDDPARAVKYFCGICWNQIRDKDK